MQRYDLTVGILSNGDAQNVRTWSGTPYFMATSLAPHFERMIYLPPVHHPGRENLVRLSRASRRYLGRSFVPGLTPAQGRRYAQQIPAELAKHSIDVLFAIAADHQLASFETEIPIVYNSDATFASMQGYYPVFTKLWDWSRRLGSQVAQEAIRRSDAHVYSSTWAANSAIADYGADPETVHVVPYGANLSDVPSREAALAANRRQACQLLFVGVEWERKGGEIAYQTLQGLRRRGIDAHLVVVGCRPPNDVDLQHITVHRFLDKRDPDARRTFQTLWLESSFLCVPSRAETYGVVFCEAASYGLPVIACQTGGIPNIVVNGETGVLMPLTANGDEFAEHVAQLWHDESAYQAMAVAARDRYEQTLNWDAWARRVAPIVAATARRQPLTSQLAMSD